MIRLTLDQSPAARIRPLGHLIGYFVHSIPINAGSHRDDSIVGDYERFARSFTQIRGPAIAESGQRAATPQEVGLGETCCERREAAGIRPRTPFLARQGGLLVGRAVPNSYL
jgi:hypothetical protein